MSKGNLLAKNLLIFLIALAVMFVVLLSLLSLAQDVLVRPDSYLQNGLSPAEAQTAIVHILIITVSVLFSYILYLLLASRARAELMTMQAVRGISASQNQFRRLYEGAPVPYLILDDKARILTANKSALRFFGMAEGGPTGKNLFSLRAEEDKDAAERLSDQYRSNIPINKEELRFQTKDGTTKWAEVSIFEMKDPKTLFSSGLATIFDITEQKVLDKAKTEFLSLASHQLRTPAATTKWHLDMLLGGDLGELSEKQRDYMNRLYAVNEGMISLVDTLLHVSRIETGTLPVETKPTNVREIVESVLSELSPAISQKELRVEKRFDESTDDMQSDPKLLRIVVQNLLSNAVKYTPPGGSVAVTLQDSSGRKTITVSDTGIGIPQEDQERIFQKMFRAGNAKDMEGAQGTGLGLYLIKSVIERMGGEISFQSEEGRGSTFIVKI